MKEFDFEEEVLIVDVLGDLMVMIMCCIMVEDVLLVWIMCLDGEIEIVDLIEVGLGCFIVCWMVFGVGLYWLSDGDIDWVLVFGFVVLCEFE